MGTTMLGSRPANDNGSSQPGAATTGNTICDGQLLTSLVNTRNAVEQLLEYAKDAPPEVQGYAAAAIISAENALARMGVVHVS